MSTYSHYFIPVLLIILIARKVMRSIGFQKFSKARLIFRICLFSFVACVLLMTAALHPFSYLTDLAGALLGAGLLYWSTKHTIFQNRGADLYYRTNIWIEVTIIALFLIRFIFRLPVLIKIFNVEAETLEERKAKIEALRDPYTGALIFILIVYYIGYSAFILKKGPAAKSIQSNEVL